MKCRRVVRLRVGVPDAKSLESVLPEHWQILEHVDPEKAKRINRVPYAFCAVDNEVDIGCDELIRSLDDALDKADWELSRLPDDEDS